MTRTSAARFLLTMKPGGAFTPASITGLSLWLDASDATTLFQDSAGTTPATANNDVIGRWADKSGNANHATQTTTANKPLLKTAVQNGKSGLLWDISNDALATAAFSSAIAQPLTLIIVGSTQTGASRYMTDGIDGSYRAAIFGNGTTYDIYAGSIGASGLAQSAAVRQFTTIFNGASSVLRNNGALVSATLNAGTNSLTGLTLGARYSATVPLGGYLFEVMLYSGALSAGNITAVESYLNTKWAVY